MTAAMAPSKRPLASVWAWAARRAGRPTLSAPGAGMTRLVWPARSRLNQSPDPGARAPAAEAAAQITRPWAS